MSPSRDEQQLPDLNEAGKAYRQAGFDDEPPAHVDALILAAAAHDGKRRLNDYLPALAMAATVVLALGLVLRLALPGRELVAPDLPTQPAAVPEAEDAAAPSLLMQEQRGPLEEAAPAIEDVTTRARSIAPQPASPTSAAADESALEGAASSATARMAAPLTAPAPCPAAERGEPGLWLTCMSTQIQAGMLDAARAELEAFRLAYPDNPVPMDITEALEP